MKALAVFEKYIDSFAITPEIVRESGFKKNPPDFYCLIPDDGEKIAGMLVYTVTPWNESGIRFYERLGAKENKDWLNFEMNL